MRLERNMEPRPGGGGVCVCVSLSASTPPPGRTLLPPSQPPWAGPGAVVGHITHTNSTNNGHMTRPGLIMDHSVPCSRPLGLRKELACDHMASKPPQYCCTEAGGEKLSAVTVSAAAGCHRASCVW